MVKKTAANCRKRLEAAMRKLRDGTSILIKENVKCSSTVAVTEIRTTSRQRVNVKKLVMIEVYYFECFVILEAYSLIGLYFHLKQTNQSTGILNQFILTVRV